MRASSWRSLPPILLLALVIGARSPAARAETKPAAKSDSKSDAKPDSKPEPKADGKPATGTTDAKTGLAADVALLTEHPNLEKFLPVPSDDHLHFGFGVAPIELLRSSTAAELSIFQLHWIHKWLDWELLNASFNMSFSSDPNAQVQSFTFRTSPKLRITRAISIGPALGFEFVSFPAVLRELRNNLTTFQTQTFEPFSAEGPLYGGELCETFHWGDFDLRLTQLAYIQTYRSNGTSGNWYYFFKNNALNADQTPLNPGPVFLFEFSLMY